MSAPAAVLQEHAIDLDVATQASWCAVAAETSNCDAQELSIEFACRPPFLVPGCLLLRLRYRAVKPVEKASWWFAGESEAVSDLTLWCIAGSDDSGEQWIESVGTQRDFNAALRKLAVLRIDADTVNGYLRTFADFATSAQDDDPRLNQNKEPPMWLIESPADIVFWTALNRLETKQLEAQLQSHPLSAPETVKNGFAITGTALLDDELWPVRLHVYDRDVDGLGERNAWKGEIHVSLVGDEPLLAGLPVNYLRALEYHPTQTVGRLGYQPEADGRERLAEKEALAIISDINRHVLPLIQYEPNVGHPDDHDYRLYPTRVYRKPLPFYDPLELSLIEISGCLQSGERVNRLVVWKPGLAASLDTRSSWIHKLNEYLRQHHRWALKSGEDALEYLKFFCEFTWLPDGPLRVIATPDEAVHPLADLESVQVNAKAQEQFSQLAGLNAEQTIQSVDEPVVEPVDQGQAWRIRAFNFVPMPRDKKQPPDVEPPGALYLSVFRVGADGAVMMEDDTALVAWRIKEGRRWRPPEPAGAIESPLDLRAESRLDEMQAPDCLQEIETRQGADRDRPVEIRNYVICGRLDLAGRTIGPLTFVNCRFRGPVSFQHVEGTAYLEFRNCVFENGLSLAEADVRGQLLAEDLVVCGGSGAAALECSDASGRSVLMNRVSLDGSLLARNLRTAGNAEFLCLEAHGLVDLMFSDIGKQLRFAWQRGGLLTCTHGYFDLDYVRALSIELSGVHALLGLYIRWASVEQSIAIQAAGNGKHFYRSEFGYYPKLMSPGWDTAGGIDLYGTVIEKNALSFNYVHVAGNVDMNFVRVGTGIWLESEDEDGRGRNLIGGNLDIGGAVLPQLLRLRRTDVRGHVYGRGMQAGEVRIAGKWKVAGKAQDESPAWEYEPIRLEGWLNLEDAKIDGEVYVTGVRSDGGFTMRHARVGGDVTLALSARQAGERKLLTGSAPDEAFLLAEFPRGVNLRKTEISGDVLLSGVQCGDGSIDISDGRIGKDLEILAQAGAATAGALALEGLHCEGNVDICGLALADTCAEDDCGGARCARDGCKNKEAGMPARRERGHVLAQGAQVAGLLRTANADASARIPGCLDLSFSQLGTLEISVDTFPLSTTCGEAAEDPAGQRQDGGDQGAQTAEACGVILQRATLGMLAVHANESGYPRPLDLRYAEIRWWEFNRRDGDSGISRRSEEPEDYISLLTDERNEPLLQRHTWRSIENNLQNWGHDTAADSVHRAMRRWLRRRPAQPIRWSWLKRLPKPIGHGTAVILSWLKTRLSRSTRAIGDFLTVGVTSPSRLLWIMGLWLALSTWLFSLPGNIGPSEQGYFIRPAELRYVVKHPDPGEWGLGAGFWTALGFHVPVAAFTARDEWEPVNDAPMIIYQAPGEMWRIRWPISAEDYGNLVLIAHWVMWPVVIVLASRRFLRRAQQQ